MGRVLPLVTRQGDRIAIVSGLRTPFARRATAFHGIPAINSGKMVVDELLARSETPAEMIEQLISGRVVQMPEAPNIARKIILGAGMNVHTDAYSVSRACATSLQAVADVAGSPMAETIRAGVAGGADSSSMLPIGVGKELARVLTDVNKARAMNQQLKLLSRLRLHNLMPVPPAVAEYPTGLWMGDTAEQMARTYGITREQQDALTHRSHQRATQAWSDGKLREEVVTAFILPYKQPLIEDNSIRGNFSLADYTELRPAFDRKHGTITAADGTPLTDGAAAVIPTAESRAEELELVPLGYLRSYAFIAIDVWQDILLGPAQSIPLMLERTGLTMSDLTLIDIHETFAAQTLANIQLLNSECFTREALGHAHATGEMGDGEFNVFGSSIAYGYPFATTGARMITQTLHELRRRGGGFGLVTAYAAGGLDAAMVLETE